MSPVRADKPGDAGPAVTSLHVLHAPQQSEPPRRHRVGTPHSSYHFHPSESRHIKHRYRVRSPQEAALAAAKGGTGQAGFSMTSLELAAEEALAARLGRAHGNVASDQIHSPVFSPNASLNGMQHEHGRSHRGGKDDPLHSAQREIAALQAALVHHEQSRVLQADQVSLLERRLAESRRREQEGQQMQSQLEKVVDELERMVKDDDARIRRAYKRGSPEKADTNGAALQFELGKERSQSEWESLLTHACERAQTAESKVHALEQKLGQNLPKSSGDHVSPGRAYISEVREKYERLAQEADASSGSSSDRRRNRANTIANTDLSRVAASVRPRSAESTSKEWNGGSSSAQFHALQQKVADLEERLTRQQNDLHESERVGAESSVRIREMEASMLVATTKAAEVETLRNHLLETQTRAEEAERKVAELTAAQAETAGIVSFQTTFVDEDGNPVDMVAELEQQLAAQAEDFQKQLEKTIEGYEETLNRVRSIGEGFEKRAQEAESQLQQIRKEVAETPQGRVASVEAWLEDLGTCAVLFMSMASPALGAKSNTHTARSLLDARKVVYRAVDVADIDSESRQKVCALSGETQWPQLFSKGSYVGGVDRIQDLVDEGTLEQAVNAPTVFKQYKPQDYVIDVHKGEKVVYAPPPKVEGTATDAQIFSAMQHTLGAAKRLITIRRDHWGGLTPFIKAAESMRDSLLSSIGCMESTLEGFDSDAEDELNASAASQYSDDAADETVTNRGNEASVSRPAFGATRDSDANATSVSTVMASTPELTIPRVSNDASATETDLDPEVLKFNTIAAACQRARQAGTDLLIACRHAQDITGPIPGCYREQLEAIQELGTAFCSVLSDEGVAVLKKELDELLDIARSHLRPEDAPPRAFSAEPSIGRMHDLSVPDEEAFRRGGSAPVGQAPNELSPTPARPPHPRVLSLQTPRQGHRGSIQYPRTPVGMSGSTPGTPRASSSVFEAAAASSPSFFRLVQEQAQMVNAIEKAKWERRRDKLERRRGSLYPPSPSPRGPTLDQTAPPYLLGGRVPSTPTPLLESIMRKRMSYHAGA